MNHKSVLSIALALVLATVGSAYAQGNSQHQRYKNDCPNGKCDGPDNRQRPNQNDRRHPAPPPQTRNNDWQTQYHRAGRDERGGGPDRAFHQGGRLPLEYRGHHLSAPPRGYHWVQNGSDYLLVAITTGIIMQLLLSN